MTEALILACLTQAAAFVAAFFFAQREHACQRAEWSAERARLLDRLMARDWREYVALTNTAPAAEAAPQVVTDEDEARYASEHGLVSA